MRKVFWLEWILVPILGFLNGACSGPVNEQGSIKFDQVTLRVSSRPQLSLVDPQDGREYFDLVPDQHAAQYYLPLKVGGQEILAVADTGSSNLIFQGSPEVCQTCESPFYTPSASAKDLQKGFAIAYGSGRGTVEQYEDATAFSGDESPIPYKFGIITQNNNLPNIIGLAYLSIARPEDEPLPTFLDQLVQSRGGKFHAIFSMLLCGRLKGSTVIMGKADSRIQRASVINVPIVQESYYVVDARSVKVVGWSKAGGLWQEATGKSGQVGDFPAFVPDQVGGHRTIVDSGSTMNILPTEIVNNAVELMKAVVTAKGLSIDPKFWTARITSDFYALPIAPEVIAQFPTFMVVMRGEGGQLVELALKPETYFKELEPGTRTFSFRKSAGLSILGQVFMENHYVEFDRENKRLGFAPNTGLCTAP